jgi:hypothetical protein
MPLVDWEVVAKIIVKDLMPDPEWHDAFAATSRALKSEGITFSWPGRSPQRWIAVLVSQELYGCFPGPEERRLLATPTVASAIEPFVTEVEKRIDART